MGFKTNVANLLNNAAQDLSERFSFSNTGKSFAIDPLQMQRESKDRPLYNPKEEERSFKISGNPDLDLRTQLDSTSLDLNNIKPKEKGPSLLELLWGDEQEVPENFGDNDNQGVNFLSTKNQAIDPLSMQLSGQSFPLYDPNYKPSKQSVDFMSAMQDELEPLNKQLSTQSMPLYDSVYSKPGVDFVSDSAGNQDFQATTPNIADLNSISMPLYTQEKSESQSSKDQETKELDFGSVFRNAMQNTMNSSANQDGTTIPSQSTGVDAFYSQSGLEPETYGSVEEQQEAERQETIASDYTEAHKEYMKQHPELGNMSPLDWSQNATFDQFYEYINDPLISPFYRNVRDRFADGADTFNEEQYQAYWDYFKPNDLAHWINSDETMLAYGTDADTARDIINYLIDNYGYDTGDLGLGTITNQSDNDSRKLAEALALYTLLDKSAQQAIASGNTGEAYSQYFTDYDLNQMSQLDGLAWTLGDMEGARTMEELGKTENWQHDPDALSLDAFRKYGVGFEGLPDALYVASDGRIKAYDRPESERLNFMQQNGGN